MEHAFLNFVWRESLHELCMTHAQADHLHKGSPWHDGESGPLIIFRSRSCSGTSLIKSAQLHLCTRVAPGLVVKLSLVAVSHFRVSHNYLRWVNILSTHTRSQSLRNPPSHTRSCPSPSFECLSLSEYTPLPIWPPKRCRVKSTPYTNSKQQRFSHSITFHTIQTTPARDKDHQNYRHRYEAKPKTPLYKPYNQHPRPCLGFFDIDTIRYLPELMVPLMRLAELVSSSLSLLAQLTFGRPESTFASYLSQTSGKTPPADLQL